ncbi:MAG: alpha/beta fold hydrolase, partial [Rhodothermales bacterium]|nr:alpha/beta fold hydrolase [Rhodothermales bacterium]
SDLANFFLPTRMIARNGALLGGLLVGISATRAGLRAAPLRSVLAAGLLLFGTWIHITQFRAYTEEPLAFENGETVLSGSLYLPSSAGPHPVVVIAHGSIQAPRAIYHLFADALARRGIAVYSFDKRGTGHSGGEYQSDNNASEENLRLLASDVARAVDTLNTMTDRFTGGVGVLGISMGGWLTPLAATMTGDIAYMVLLSGPAVSVGEEGYFSNLAGDNFETEQLVPVAVADSLTRLEDPSGFDPRPTLGNLQVPGLWVLGLQDTSIPSRMTADVISAFAAAGKPYEFRMYPGADHLGFGTEWPYDLEPNVIEDMVDWIHRQASTAGATP